MMIDTLCYLSLSIGFVVTLVNQLSLIRRIENLEIFKHSLEKAFKEVKTNLPKDSSEASEIDFDELFKKDE